MLGGLRSRAAQLWPGHDVTATLDDDEEIEDVVRPHHVVLVVPALVGFLGLALVLARGWPRAADLLGLGLVGWAVWQAVQRQADRFVITNHRVFRVRGVLRRSRASMPIQRVLDITVHKPLLGLLVGYGHFIFESAAQEQGLREIRFVARPDERELTIQRLIHPRRTAEAAPASGHCHGCRCVPPGSQVTPDVPAYSWPADPGR